MSKLDLSKFRKVDHNKSHTIMRSPEGIELHIPHEGLDKKHVKALKHLPIDRKMAKGGQVKEVIVATPPDKRSAISSAFNANTGASGVTVAANNAKKAVGYADGGDVEQSGDYAAPPPIAPQDQQAANEMPMSLIAGQSNLSAPPEAQIASPGDVFQQPAPILPPTPQQAPPGLPEPKNAYDDQMRAIQQEGKAKVAESNAIADAEKAKSDQLGKQQQAYEDAIKPIQAQADATMQAYADGKIDANHYFHESGTAGRIGTGIGLILGGLGGALTGQENPAMKFLNQQIDRDIDMQKANLGKQKSLYEFNLQRMGDARAAANMTRINLLDKTAADINAAGARAKGPVEKARAAQAMAIVKQQSDALKAQTAQRQAILGAAKQGGDPSQLVPLLVPKERQAEVFKEIKKAQDMKADIPLLMNLYDRAAKGVGVGSAVGVTPEASQALENAYLKHLKDDVGRINETELHTASNTFPQAIDKLSGDRAKKRREDFYNNLLRGTSAPTAKGYGIDLASMGPQVAPETKTMNGVQYQKVQGGWAPVDQIAPVASGKESKGKFYDIGGAGKKHPSSSYLIKGK